MVCFAVSKINVETLYFMNIDKLAPLLVESESDMKSLWRLSGGSYSAAFKILKDTAKRYSVELTIEDFDEICARQNDNCDVEWGLE